MRAAAAHHPSTSLPEIHGDSFLRDHRGPSEPLEDLTLEFLAGGRLPVDQEGLLWRLCKATRPAQQLTLTGVAGEGVDPSDVGAHRNLLAVQAETSGAI
jgi:hypothetical protein